MFEVVSREILLWLLHRTLRYPAPENKFDEKERYYLCYLHLEDERTSIVVDSLSATQIHGRAYKDKKFARNTKIPIKDLPSYSLKVLHRYHGFSREYDGLIKVLLSECFQTIRLLPITERIRQRIFNKTTRFRHKRIEILRRVYDIHVSSAGEIEEQCGAIFGHDTSYDDFSLFLKLYGDRIVQHPDFNREFSKFKLVLDSLVESRELCFEDEKYKFTPAAITTISEYEEQELRHRDSDRHNKGILFLTLVVALSAASGMYVDLFGNPFSEEKVSTP